MGSNEMHESTKKRNSLTCMNIIQNHHKVRAVITIIIQKIFKNRFIIIKHISTLSSNWRRRCSQIICYIAKEVHIFISPSNQDSQTYPKMILFIPNTTNPKSFNSLLTRRSLLELLQFLKLFLNFSLNNSLITE